MRRTNDSMGACLTGMVAEALLVSDGLVFDLRDMWSETEIPDGRHRHSI